MTKKRQDFEVWAGEDKDISFQITGSDGAGYDLSSACAIWIIEEYQGSGSIVKKTTDDYITISGSLVNVILSGSDTGNLGGIYYHELSGSTNSGCAAALAVGHVRFHKRSAI